LPTSPDVRLTGRRLAAGLLAAAGIASLALVVGELDPTAWHLARVGSATYVLAGVFAFVEVGTPLGLVTPSELAVPLAGAAAAAGAVGLLPLILVVWVCAALGDSSGYLTGRLLGARVHARLGHRSRRWQRHHATLVSLFARHGVRTVLLGRWVPYARTATPLLAGSSGMSYRSFVIASVCGSGVWAAALCTAGWAFAASVDLLIARLGQAGIAMGVALLTAAVLLAARRRRQAPQMA
jgi:membrane-associated protein